MAQMDGEYVPVHDLRLTYPCGEAPDANGAVEVAQGVFWLRRPLPFSLAWINVWLLEDGDGWTLVDTGIGDTPSKKAWDDAAASVLKGRPINRIICTHMHPDHIGCAGYLSRRYNAPLMMTPLEYITARMLVADTGRQAPKEGMDFYRAAGLDDAALELYRSRFGGFGSGVTPLPESYLRLSEGDELLIGRRTWRVVLGNGHSPEHACLWEPEGKLLISGDQILPRISSNVSVHPTEPEADPLLDWLDSCRKLRDFLPEDALVLPAHNEPFRGVHVRLDNLLSGHQKKLDRVWSRLAEPKRVVDLYGAMFARDIGDDPHALAAGETLAHLHRLIGEGRVKRSVGHDGVWRYQQA
ncbi:MAG: MBL fold metallo-hydrolase [Caulobacterales bacterium]